MAKQSTVFDDEDFLDHLVLTLINDVDASRRLVHLMKVDDFKPVKGSEWGQQRWIVAEVVLEYYNSHHSPIKTLVRSSTIEYAQKTGLSVRIHQEIDKYLERLKKLPIVSSQDIIGKVTRYKGEVAKARAIEELQDLQMSGELTDERWMEVSKRALVSEDHLQGTDYFNTLGQRIERRASANHREPPWFFIDPLDQLVRGVGPGQLGMVAAPPKRGKSLFLEWLAMVFPLQRIPVLYFTLEDPQTTVEDRLDSAFCHVPYHALKDNSRKLAHRFERFRRRARSGLRIYDGTANGISIAQVEQIYLRERESGFDAQAIVIDYDQEISPSKRLPSRIEEYDQIYRDFRRMLARHDLIGWTAAQTQRGTEDFKVLTGSRLAEDYGKVRKCAMCVTLGKGEWGDDEDNAFYMFVAAHKFDRKHVGCNIVADKEHMAIYDREATRRAALLAGEGASVDDEEEVYT